MARTLIDFATSLQWWHWWIFAAALGISEAFVPRGVAIWFCAAAALVGGLRLLTPYPWFWQIALFFSVALALCIVWRGRRGLVGASARPRLDQWAARHVGEVCILSEPIVDGYGKVHIGEGDWTVRGADLPAGVRVRIQAVEGVLLIVEAA